MRPPARKSCTGTMNSQMPEMEARLRRKRPTTALELMPRSAKGFRLIRMRP